MANDRTVRSLGALGGAATSRVLNLCRVAETNADMPEHAEKPLFLSPVINRGFIVKHRVRDDESYLFNAPRSAATKLIVPFDPNDLRAGGRSLFVGQRGYREALRQLGHYGEAALDRDLVVLELLDDLPSLDPFLLREQLRCHRIDAAPCYFALSEGDQRRMHRFTSGELAPLVSMAVAAPDTSGINRVVAALLANAVDEKLEPLRLTLGMSDADFREGVFSWRGFLYYKWSMQRFWPDVMHVLRQLHAVRPRGPVSVEQRAYLTAARLSIIERVRDHGADVNRALSVYDESFRDLVARRIPKTFRDFLLSAPRMFLDLGEKLGAISHIVSFWQYRFPANRPAPVDAEELTAIFQDFSAGFGDMPPPDRDAAPRPAAGRGRRLTAGA